MGVVHGGALCSLYPFLKKVLLVRWGMGGK